jgi:hypothetical protein
MPQNQNQNQNQNQHKAQNVLRRASNSVNASKKAVAELAVPDAFAPRRMTRSHTTSGWMLPDRAGFPKWIAENMTNANANANANANVFMPSQRFVKDFLNPNSPYRGLLLYHQVGSGKTCSSIYAAENFMDSKDVVVMLPATVRKNYIKEIKFTCGNQYFSPKRRWRFVDLNEMKLITGDSTHALKMFADVTRVDAALIRRQKGVWVPCPSTHPDRTSTALGFTAYADLDDLAKESIGHQLDAIVASKYQFIHYNGGVKESNVEEMERSPKNPFDGKVVVIDEVHNFVSRAIGPGKTGAPLYRLLLNAKDCKLILLSGTPVVNHPYEAAAIVNLIRGPRTKHTFSFDRSKPFGVARVKRVIESDPRIDHHKLDLGSRRIDVWLCPEGFEMVGNGKGIVRRIESSVSTSHESIVKSLAMALGDGVTHKSHRQFVLPMNKDDFTSAFIDTETLQVKRPASLQRRMMGCISYFQTSGSSDYPKREPDTMIIVPMSDHMFSTYSAVREDEIKDEKRQRMKQESGKSGKPGGVLDIPSTYKSHSRETCNFVFPKSIKRVYKKKSSDASDANDANDTDAAEFAGETDGTMDQTDAARMAALRKSGEMKGMNRLATYCPKARAMIEYIDACKGKCVVYSNFKIAEGLGHLAVALEANGWVELKLRQTTEGVWELDTKSSPVGKHTFFKYEADRKDVPVLMSIFNMGRSTANTDGVPANLLKQLGGTTNLRGEMIKMMMFTKSGAEGLDLKHVRQVHVMEPYWHEVRIQQVIGRAIRLRSHTDLPESERKVNVYRYMSTLTPKQRNESKTILAFDRGMTSDEIVFEVAKRKHKLTLSVLASMKAAAVDCAYHRKHHRSEIPCLSARIGSNPEDQAYDINAPYDMLGDVDVNVPVRRDCKIDGKPYMFSPSDMTVYDKENGKKVGHLKLVSDKYHFVKLGSPKGGGRKQPRRGNRRRKPTVRK